MKDFVSSVPNETWWWIGSLSVFTFITSLVILPLVIVRMSEDYFLIDRNPDQSFKQQRPLARVLGLILKNLLGVILVLAGTIMLLTPGQGILTVLIGLMLLNFPGKRKLELFLVSMPRVRTTINWIRKKADRAPLLLPNEGIRQCK